MSERAMWVIYSRPADMPECEYVARRWVMSRRGVQPTEEVMAASLAQLRQHFALLGLVSLGPHRGDDPCIVESWF